MPTRLRPNSAYYSRSSTGEPMALGLGSMRTLAVLLLADGRIVPGHEIAPIGLPWGGATESVGTWIATLRRYGVQIETNNPYGYRLLALPPDDLLDDVLVLVHQIRAERPTRLWSLIGRAERPPSRADRAGSKGAPCRTRISA